MQNLLRENMAPKRLKQRVWDGLGLHLGGVWAGLEPLVGALGGSLGALGVLLGCFWAVSYTHLTLPTSVTV